VNEAVQMIQTVGFPIFISIWFMFRTEKVIKNNTKALVLVMEKMK